MNENLGCLGTLAALGLVGGVGLLVCGGPGLATLAWWIVVPSAIFTAARCLGAKDRRLGK